MAKSTRKKGKRKPAKPHADFPLFPHASGRWAKKIRGKFCYFGKVANDPDGQKALALWLDQRDDLLAGRTPRTKREGLTVSDLANRFLTTKRHLLDTRELSPRTWADYFSTCQRLVAGFGRDRLVIDLAADDFEALRAYLTKTMGPNTLANEINRVRVLFKYGYEAGLIERPVRYGPAFKRPSRRVLRQARHDKGPRLFEASELRAILDKAEQPLRAMVLLGINCGFGNGDVANLQFSNLDLDKGWANFPRPKTAIERRCPLWRETIEAIQEATAARKEPKDAADKDAVFLTRCRTRWVKVRPKVEEDEDGNENQEGMIVDDAVSKAFTKVLKQLKLHRPGLGFYSLRHTFQTIGEGSKDAPAVGSIMGHADASMAAVYRQRIDDSRLVAVVNHVRTWLFGSEVSK